MKRNVILLILTCLVLYGAIHSQETVDQKITKREKMLSQTKGKERIEALLLVAEAYFSRSTEKMLRYAGEALALARQMKDRSGESHCYYVIGIAYNLEGKNDLAFENWQNALKCAEEAKNKELVAKSWLALGNHYQSISNYERALDCHLKSLKISEETGDDKNIALCFANIGLVYYYLTDYEKSIDYMNQSIRRNVELKEYRTVARCYKTIGSCNRDLKRFKESLGNYYIALKMFEEIGDTRGISGTQISLGHAYNEIGDYRKALDYFSVALKKSQMLKSSVSVLNCLTGIGLSYVRLKQYDDAFPRLQEAMKMASDKKDNNQLKCVYLAFLEFYESQGNYKKALEFLKLQMKTDSELINEKNLQHINNLQIQYDTLKRKSENERLLHENELQGLRLTKAKLVRNASVVGFAMILVILALLFQKYLYLFAFWKKEKYIGRYRLLDRIAAGGMSVVYKAHSIKEKSDKVAVKILKEEFSRDDSVIQRFKQEAMIIDKLDHPNIVKIHERGEDRNRLFIAMEYLDGKTLAEVIAKESPIGLNVSLHIMTQLADALSQIHGKKIVHRDLKPSNIIVLSREGNDHFVKLLDFGLARARFQSTLTQTGELLGTIGYMSPEQLLDGEITAASDIYSLGVIFYETLCGERAFPGENEIVIIKRILDEMPKAPQEIRPEIPDAWNRLIMKMLDKDSGRRPTLEEFRNQANLFYKNFH